MSDAGILKRWINRLMKEINGLTRQLAALGDELPAAGEAVGGRFRPPFQLDADRGEGC
ncbi:MAG TPA: hypothetical protein VEL74_12870 [Thermoanaerobaculia bacterium]|nr:hypothetical protein [Thermoanaerobaculia bacterium]